MSLSSRHVIVCRHLQRLCASNYQAGSQEVTHFLFPWWWTATRCPYLFWSIKCEKIPCSDGLQILSFNVLKHTDPLLLYIPELIVHVFSGERTWRLVAVTLSWRSRDQIVICLLSPRIPLEAPGEMCVTARVHNIRTTVARQHLCPTFCATCPFYRKWMFLIY